LCLTRESGELKLLEVTMLNQCIHWDSPWISDLSTHESI